MAEGQGKELINLRKPDGKLELRAIPMPRQRREDGDALADFPRR